MTVSTSTEARFFISSTTITASTDTITEYAALVWVEVGEVEDLGQFGDTSNEVTFTSLKDGRVRKFKGSKNAGTMALVCGDDPADLGQKKMDVAEVDSRFEYGFKVVINNQVTSNGLDGVDYFRGLVMSNPKTVGASDNIVRINYSIAINSAILSVDPT
jgi:hypothetical protein